MPESCSTAPWTTAGQAASAPAGSLDKPCLEVVQGSGDQVARRCRTCSVNLARGDTIYCSSLCGPVSGKVLRGTTLPMGGLDLMKGQPVTPNRPLIVYREAGEFSVLGRVDGLPPAQHTGHAEPQLAPRAGGGAADAAPGQPAH